MPTQLSACWSEPIPKNGIITAYSVYCNTSANQSYPEQVIGSNVPIIISVVNGTTQAVMLTELNPYTQYGCYVTANTSVGEGSPSNIVTVQTAESGNKVIYALSIPCKEWFLIQLILTNLYTQLQYCTLH